MPKRLQELINNRTNAKKVVKKEKKTKRPGLLAFEVKQDGDSKGASRDLKKMPDKVMQGAYETSDQFIGRLDRMTSAAFAEANLSIKHNVDFCPKILSTSTSSSSKKQIDFSDKFGDRKREKRRLKDIRKRAKKRAKKNPEKDYTDFDDLKDEFKFGEVVMRPPMLQKRKKLKS